MPVPAVLAVLAYVLMQGLLRGVSCLYGHCSVEASGMPGLAAWLSTAVGGEVLVFAFPFAPSAREQRITCAIKPVLRCSPHVHKVGERD